MSCTTAPPTARQTMLHTDPAYARLLDAQSRWPTQYVFATTWPASCSLPIDGRTAQYVGPAQVGAYNALLPRHERVRVRASQHRLGTELFGTAPYMIRRGQSARVDDWTRLRQSSWSQNADSRQATAEVTYDLWDFVSVPPQLQNLPETRLGKLTRVGPEYLQPRD